MIITPSKAAAGVLFLLSRPHYFYLLAPLIRRLGEDPEVSLSFASDDAVVASLLAETFARPTLHSDYDPAIIDGGRPRLIVTCDLWWSPVAGLLDRARALDVPVLLYEHGSLTYPCEFEVIGDDSATAYRGDCGRASHIVCWGERGRECWASYGVTDDKFALTGAPHLDPVYRIDREAARHAVRRRLGGDGDDRLNLVLMTSHVPQMGLSDANAALLNQVAERVAATPAERLVIKHHPMDYVRFARSPERYPPGSLLVHNRLERGWEGSAQIDFDEVVAASDRVFCIPSSAIIAPLIRDLPVICADGGMETARRFMAFAGDGILRLADDHPAVGVGAGRPAPPAGSRALAESLNFGNDGEATERFHQLVIEIIRRGAGHPWYPRSLDDEQRAAIETFPDLPYPYRAHVLRLCETGRFERAAEWVDRYRARFGCARSLLDEVYGSVVHGPLPAAEQRRVLDLFDRFDAATDAHWRGVAARRAGRPAEAAAQLARAKGHAGDAERARRSGFELGMAYAEAGDFQQAAAEFGAVLEGANPRDPLYERALYRRGWSHARAGRRSAAAADLERCLEFNPSHRAARSLAGELAGAGPSVVEGGPLGGIPRVAGGDS